MINLNIKTKVKHSKSKTAWHVIGTMVGGKYYIATCSYSLIKDDEIHNTRAKYEALTHAQFINQAFNNTLP